MEKLVSSWFRDKSLPQDYIFPSDKRPGKDHAAAPCNAIPVIDLGKADGGDRNDIIQQILEASQDFGFFQVINHGVSEGLMDDTMNLFLEFFDMPNEDKAELYSEDPRAKIRLYTSNNYANEEFHFWRDNLRHPCNPLEECINLWPTKPGRYRGILGAYSVKVRNMLLQILDLMREGLALQSNDFPEELTREQTLSVNHYLPCPEPSLTLGLPRTAVHQGDIPGLQVLKDGKWIGVEALPYAFVVNIGLQLQVITNGKLKSAEHRAVTNSSHNRTTIVTFLLPDSDSIIEPARALLDNKPPLYSAFKYGEFISSYIEKENRPGQLPFPTWNTIPVIDLQNPTRNDTIQQILDAGQTYGFFQVINHGVSKQVSNDTIGVFREYFEMRREEKQCAEDKNGWIYMGSTDFAKDGIHLWRESIKHSCYPLMECKQSWPQKPTQYREIVSTYLEKIRNLSCRILELIGEGLGLEAGYLEEISQVQLLAGNYYPPCPDPSLTLGLLKHCDPSLITILLQEDVSGLQVLLNDGKWMVVSAIPDAFVVNIGNQLQIISNGKLRSLEHRAVTNKDKGRISIASFINPSPNCTVEPAKVLVDEMNPALYKPSLYQDFVYTPKVYDRPTEATVQEPTGAKA